MIRCAEADDINAINLYLREFETSKISIDDFINHPYSKYIVMEENSQIIGFLKYQKIYDRYELNYIFINQQKRNYGYGNKLIKHFIEIVKREKGINITLEVSSQNTKAISLYKKNNFKVVASREKYYGNVDGFLMLREM